MCWGRNSPRTVTRSLRASAARFSWARPVCHMPSAIPAAQAAAATAMAQALGRKEYPPGMRYVVIAMLIAILVSLGSAAVFMLRSRGDSTRLAKPLTWRIALSVALFVLLMLGYALGLFQPGRL